MQNSFLAVLNYLAVIFPAFLLAFTVRGFFKALAAKLTGDLTAQDEGFLSFNPTVHINLWGLLPGLLALVIFAVVFAGDLPRALLFVVIVFFGVRWINPVPIDESNFKNYSLGVILTTLAPAFGNFILALLFLYILKYFPYAMFPAYVVMSFSEIFNAVVDLSIFFGILDLLPIPPFDGGRLLEFVLPKSCHNVIVWLNNYSIYILLALFVLPGISDLFFGFLYLMRFFVKLGLMHLVF